MTSAVLPEALVRLNQPTIRNFRGDWAEIAVGGGLTCPAPPGYRHHFLRLRAVRVVRTAAYKARILVRMATVGCRIHVK
jgi:hypothetical protein